MSKKLKQIEKKDKVFWSYIQEIDNLKKLQETESNALKKKAYSGKIKKLTQKTIKYSAFLEKEFEKHKIIVS